MPPPASTASSDIRLMNCPSLPTPSGPPNQATSLITTSPEASRAAVATAESAPALTMLIRCASEKVACGDHLADVRVRHGRSDRQAQHLAMNGFRERQGQATQARTGGLP